MKILCISDVHHKYEDLKLQEADILIIAGDVTMYGQLEEWAKFLAWIKTLKFKSILFVFGNHDFYADGIEFDLEKLGVTVLTDDTWQYTKPDGTTLRFYGSPWQKDLPRWAWHKDEDGSIQEKWDAIPDDTDVLITHVPPEGILDAIPPFSKYGNGAYNQHVGDEYLFNRIKELKKLKLHVFGHIHESHGVHTNPDTKLISVNAAICDDSYTHVYKPIEINL